MIELLEALNKKNKPIHIPAEVWHEWELSSVTIQFKQRLLEEMIIALDNLVDGDLERDQFFRGQLNSLELAINYKPENVNDKHNEKGEAD